MKTLVLMLLFAGADVVAAEPCANVLAEAASAATPELELQRLGACLAAPASSEIHRRVVLEMARVSLREGEPGDVERYLDLLGEMLESDAEDLADGHGDRPAGGGEVGRGCGASTPDDHVPGISPR